MLFLKKPYEVKVVFCSLLCYYYFLSAVTKMKHLFSGMYEYHTKSVTLDLSSFVPTQFSSTEKAVCLLRILQDKGKTIVIVTELATNQGLSVTNAAEVLASKIVEQFHLDPTTTRFIEHYGKESYGYEDERAVADVFDEVTFVWNGMLAMSPTWKRADGKEMKKLLKKNKQKVVN